MDLTEMQEYMFEKIYSAGFKKNSAGLKKKNSETVHSATVSNSGVGQYYEGTDHMTICQFSVNVYCDAVYFNIDYYIAQPYAL